jgi:hypothetical protein
MKQLKIWLMPSILAAVLLASSGGALADVVAIVNKANTAADKVTIGKLYTLEAKSWPDGTQAKLYDLPVGTEREEFCMTYTGQKTSSIKSTWAKAVFTGRGVPPTMLDSDADVKNEVAKNKNAVGYVDESNADGSVRVVR